MLRIASAVALGIAVVAVWASFAARRRGGSTTPGRTPSAQPLVLAPPAAPTGAVVGRHPVGGGPQRLPSAAAGSPPAQSTHYGRLILDARFAERIGLRAALGGLELAGKRVTHTPQEHLLTALVNIWAGHDQLQQISRGETPLRSDRSLAQAWGQAEFPEVSGVCRALHACDWATAAAVRRALAGVFAPYVTACAGRAQARGGRLAVEWDLTPKPVTTDATSEPFAAYGHMAEGMGKGYQWAEAVLRGVGPDGAPRPVSLGGFLKPGNAHPPECLEGLRQLTEASLGRPRRRPEWLEVRLAAAEAECARRQSRLQALNTDLEGHQRRLEQLRVNLRAIEQRLAGRTAHQPALRARDEQARATLAQRLERAECQVQATQTRLTAAQTALTAAEAACVAMRIRLQRLHADNAALDATDQSGVAIELVLDAAFGGRETVASLLEEGYEVTTKAASPATMAKLRRRAEAGEAVFGTWRPVSANAEVAECTETRYAGCPHPLRLLGYRKHLAASASRPAQTNHALFLTSRPASERGAEQTVDHYHRRGGSVELVNRQAKSYLGFRGHRLRHAPGLDILGQFVFAGLNFVPWLADTLWTENNLPSATQPGFAEWMRMARAPADLLADPEGVVVQFRPESGWPGRRLQLGVVRQLPLPGFAWPGVPIDAQLAA